MVHTTFIPSEDCPQDSGGGDGESQECKDAQAITHKDYQGDDDAGTHVAQCFDINTNSEEDVTKWTFEKGTGSCAVCKDAAEDPK